ncbi:prolipoprotein diacylglyceryl transferase [Nonomuraea sp. B12E4]|uniref:prolipoprotein diacylglyceryl transferase n=1 Tax=Nonomuraea sp. B12E4 TaxID=3153564 RepID=UPI00325CCFE1
MPLASIPSPSQGVWYLGIIPIRAYALCIVLGVIVAVWLSERRWRARGGQKGTIIDIAVPAVIFGLIGGRLYHVITDWQTYFGSRAVKEPYQALFIWEGGLGIWGAVALGGVGVWWAARGRGLSMTAIADTVAPGIAFAQAIGRWGNWFNQELYGGPTTLPWGLEIDVDHGGEPGVLYHPTFLYESLWDVALGFVLIFAGRRFALRHGRLFALYVAGYTLGRFWIEGLRIDPVGGVDHAVIFLGLRINQWTSLVLFAGALVYLWATRNKDSEEVVLPATAADADPAHAAGQADGGDAERRDEDTGETPEGGTPGKRGDEPEAGDTPDGDGTDESGPQQGSPEKGGPEQGGPGPGTADEPAQDGDPEIAGPAEDAPKAEDGPRAEGGSAVTAEDGPKAADGLSGTSEDLSKGAGRSPGTAEEGPEGEEGRAEAAAPDVDAVTKEKNSR